MGFSGQECWSGLPCPPPGGPPTPDVEPPSPVSPALQADFYHLSHVFHTFPLSPCFSHIILDFFSWGIFQLTNYLISYIWFRASLVAQTIKNLPAMQETWVRFLGQEDPLEKGMATHSSVLPGDFMDREAWWATVHGVPKIQTWLGS